MKKLEGLIKESYKEPVNDKLEDAKDSILARLKDEDSDSSDSDVEFNV